MEICEETSVGYWRGENSSKIKSFCTRCAKQKPSWLYINKKPRSTRSNSMKLKSTGKNLVSALYKRWVIELERDTEDEADKDIALRTELRDV